MECVRLHGVPVNGYSGWQPVQYISAISSSYCRAPTATQILDDFLSNWTASSSIDIGTSTLDVDVLGASTEVSLYFTLTSSATTTAMTGSAKGTATSGVAASPTGKDSASGAVTGSATGSATAVSTTGSKSAAAGLQLSGIWAAAVLAAAIVL